MSKFKVGDRVKILSGGYPNDTKCADGDIAEVVEVLPNESVMVLGDDPDAPGQKYHWCFMGHQVEPVIPTEHPALTLAKAEVVRIRALNDIKFLEGVRLAAFTEVLRAFGLECRAKPVVLQPEYEFVAIEGDSK